MEEHLSPSHTSAFWASGTGLTAQPWGSPVIQTGCCVVSRDVFIDWLILAPPIHKEGSTQPCAETPLGWKTAAVRQTSGIAWTGRGRKRRKTASVQGCRGTPARQRAEFGQDTGKSNTNLKKVIKKKDVVRCQLQFVILQPAVNSHHISTCHDMEMLIPLPHHSNSSFIFTAGDLGAPSQLCP